MLIYGVFQLIQRLSRSKKYPNFRCLDVAVNRAQQQEVEQDRRVSRNFLNLLQHLMDNIRLSLISMSTLFYHPFFLEPSQIIHLLEDASEVFDESTTTNKIAEAQQYRDFVFPTDLNWRDTRDEVDTYQSYHPEADKGYDWRVRVYSNKAAGIHPNKIEKLIMDHRAAFRHKTRSNSSSKSSSALTASQNSVKIACNYRGESLKSLMGILRNISVNWMMQTPATLHSLLQIKIGRNPNNSCGTGQVASRDLC